MQGTGRCLSLSNLLIHQVTCPSSNPSLPYVTAPEQCCGRSPLDPFLLGAAPLDLIPHAVDGAGMENVHEVGIALIAFAERHAH